MKTRFLWLAFALVGILVIAGLWLFAGGALHPGAPPSIISHTGSRLSRPTFDWREGARTAYILKQLSSPIGQPGGGVKVEGIIHLRVLEVKDGKARIGLLGSGLRVQENGSRLKQVEALLETVPCVVTMSQRGQILEMGFTGEVASEDLLSLAGFYGTQFVLPPAGNVSHWRLIEEDANSSWNASYKLLPGGIEMSKQRVARVASPAAGLPIRVDSSQIRSARGAVWLSFYDSDETWSFLNGPEVVLSIRSQLHLTETVAAEPPALSMLKPGTALVTPSKALDVLRQESLTGDADGVSSIQRDKTEILRERYANLGAGDLVDQLRSALANAKGHEDTVPAIHSLRDMLLAYPDRAMEVASLAMKNSGEAALTARLVHALELAGSTAEAQSALAGILDTKDGLNDELRLQAAVAAGGIGSLKGTELREALYRAVRSENIEVSDAAGFALGSVAKNNPDLQKVLAEGYGPVLSGQNENPDDQRVALRILANGGIAKDSILADATRLAESNRDREVRIAAIDYLGKVSADQPQPLIAALSDAEVGVRLAAIKALTGSAQNTVESINAVARVLTDPSAAAATRQAAANGLANQAARFPEARQALVQALNQNDTSVDLREQIQGLLADPAQPFFPK